MSNPKVKISSNPYTKTLEFSFWNNGWYPIDLVSSPSSKLLNKDITGGFFPFKIEEVLHHVLDEYHVGSDPVEVVFEGPSDEFAELSATCSSAEYLDKIALSRGEKSLANARDALPEIIKLFEGIHSLIDEESLDEKTANELKKFRDASSDRIPLCILGNYSAGKSTFINALVGSEILPNSDMPTTAKIFKITRSKYRDRARVSLGYGGRKVDLRFDADGLVVDFDSTESPLHAQLTSAVEGSVGMTAQMSKILQTINEYEPSAGEAAIDDLVSVEVPFSRESSWAFEHEFVIFDTPGSNSASNEDHARVLKKAMEGLSNGLPIYIAEYCSLDSMDNVNLYNEVRKIEAIDERFAMIALNKADSADLPRGGFEKRQVDQIMEKAMPRHLYAQGIYFVSSILGLGAKTGGEFISDNYAEKYEDQQRKYSDPGNRFYKELYRYNILPGQALTQAILQARECPNLVLVNSGLHSIEQAIVTFAEKYSAYNKCHQSEVLLGRVMEATDAEIARRRSDYERKVKECRDQLDKDKAHLLDDLKACGSDGERNARERYIQEMAEQVEARTWFKPADELKAREGELTQENRVEHGVQEDSDAARAAQAAIIDNFAQSFGEALTSFDGAKVAAALKGLAADVEDAGLKKARAIGAKRKAESEASDELLAEVRDGYEAALSEMAQSLERHSRAFWENYSEISRRDIYNLATSDTVLSEEKRREIADIIMRYRPLHLKSDASSIFQKSKFEGFRIWDIVIFQSTHLDLPKVSRTFNNELESALEELREQIRSDHAQSYHSWLAELLGKIEQNITEYNPELNKQVRQIQADEREIEALTGKLDKLRCCSRDISKLIDWRCSSWE